MPVKIKTSISAPKKKIKTISGTDLDKVTTALDKLPAWVSYDVVPLATPKLDKAKKVTEATLKATPTVTRPKWAEYSKTTKARKAEWDRMDKAIDAYVKKQHEGFVKAAEAMAKALQSEDLDKAGWDKLWKTKKADLIAVVTDYADSTNDGYKLGVLLEDPGPDPAVMKADIKKPKVSDSNAVSGTSISAVFDALQKKPYWGRYRPNQSFSADFALDGCLSTFTIKAVPTIKMPKWKQYSKGNADQKKTWDKMYKTLLKHENNHHAFFLETAAIFLDRIKDLGLTRSETQKEWDAYVVDLQDIQNAYDDRSDHGVNEGVELDMNADP